MSLEFIKVEITDAPSSVLFSIHGKSVCKTWNLNVELVKTGLTLRYRS
jgi:hypothetical protein